MNELFYASFGAIIVLFVLSFVFGLLQKNRTPVFGVKRWVWCFIIGALSLLAFTILYMTAFSTQNVVHNYTIGGTTLSLVDSYGSFPGFQFLSLAIPLVLMTIIFSVLGAIKYTGIVRVGR